MTVSVNIKVLDTGLSLPSFATQSSAGMDLYAAIEGDITLIHMQRLLIPTGIAIALPDGFEAQIRPRSGLALKHGVTCLNTPGTIDADYRGEINVLLINLGQEPFVITRGMRIAQMIIGKYSRIDWEVVQSLDETTRGTGGFGSTGLK
jgi:dUTP pyrophosphatase